MPGESNKAINDIQNLNPQVATVMIGVRNLRKITLYPLSVGDQIKMTNMIANKITGFVSLKDGGNDAEMIGFFIDLISNNISMFLGMSICEKPNEEGKYPESGKLLDDTTNLQVSIIASEIFKMNFEDSIKNFKDLFEKVKSLFPSERSLPQSVKDTITDLSTSSEKLS